MFEKEFRSNFCKKLVHIFRPSGHHLVGSVFREISLNFPALVAFPRRSAERHNQPGGEQQIFRASNLDYDLIVEN